MDNIPLPTPEETTTILKQFDAFNLEKQMDRAKAQVLMGKFSSFLGPLMCAHNFVWDRGIPTACTNGITMRWNPYWFALLPAMTRVTVLVHELMHPGRLHMIRLGDRDPQLFNYACDVRINNDLHELGYSFKGTRPWMTDPAIHPAGMAEEDIYDDLAARKVTVPPGGPFALDPSILDELTADMLGGDEELLKSILDSLKGGTNQDGDILPMTEDDITASINAVVQADMQSKLTGGGGIGDMPGGKVSYILEQFLAPKVAWEKVLGDWMNELSGKRTSWRKPRRRIQHIYLPGKVEDRSGLSHLAYMWDVSGSIDEAMEIRFNSEVRFIKDRYSPEKLTLVQFDTEIQDVQMFEKNEPFQDIKIIGKGGNEMDCVRVWLNENRPTAAIIFTDLHYAPLKPLDFDIPILWVVVGNPSTPVPFGKRVDITL